MISDMLAMAYLPQKHNVFMISSPFTDPLQMYLAISCLFIHNTWRDCVSFARVESTMEDLSNKTNDRFPHAQLAYFNRG